MVDPEPLLPTLLCSGVSATGEGVPGYEVDKGRKALLNPQKLMGLGRDPVLLLSLQKLKTQSYWKEREFLLKDCTVWRGWNRNDWERGERHSLVPRKTVPVVSQRQSDGVKQWERCFNGWKQWETDTWGKNWMDATKQNRGTITASSHSLTLSHTHTPLSLSGQSIATWPPSWGCAQTQQ